MNYQEKSFLQEAIQELLYRYDLIIIPDFGAIIGRRKSARYNEKTHLFSPPYKDVSFNSGLKENDGLLVNYIAGKFDISHNEAMEKIRSQVAKWKAELKENKRLVLENIGIFSSVNDKIIFQALLNKNFLPASYGLTSFIKTKSPQTNITMENENKATEQKIDDFLNKSQNKNKKNEYLKYAAVVVIGLALLGGGLYFYNHSKTPDSFQKASFVVEKDLPEVKVTDTATLENGTETAVETESPATTQTEETTTETGTTASVTQNDNTELTQYKYQIVVGGFKYKNNAEKKVNELQEKGYNAQIIGKNSKGLYIVAVDGGDDLNELTKKLPAFFELEPQAWIYKSK